MSEHDDALVEKAAYAVALAERRRNATYDDIAIAVLDAVADDLRAEAWDEGYTEAWTPECWTSLDSGPNPYRRGTP